MASSSSVPVQPQPAQLQQEYLTTQPQWPQQGSRILAPGLGSCGIC